MVCVYSFEFQFPNKIMLQEVKEDNIPDEKKNFIKGIRRDGAFFLLKTACGLFISALL